MEDVADRIPINYELQGVYHWKKILAALKLINYQLYQKGKLVPSRSFISKKF